MSCRRASRAIQRSATTCGRGPLPLSKDNAARYPADWKLRSHFVRFVRAKGCCEWCGAVHGLPNPRTGAIVYLTTAHVYDQRPEAASLLNLAALCQSCHLNHDKQLHKWARWRKRRAQERTGELFAIPKMEQR